MIENTFTSLRNLIPSVIPALRYATFLCHQIWDSQKAIEEIKDHVPVLFLSGSRDELIPSFHMKRLYRVLSDSRKEAPASGQDKGKKNCSLEFVAFEDGTHNDTCMQPGYFDAIQAFWKQCIAVGSK